MEGRTYRLLPVIQDVYVSRWTKGVGSEVLELTLRVYFGCCAASCWTRSQCLSCHKRSVRFYAWCVKDFRNDANTMPGHNLLNHVGPHTLPTFVPKVPCSG